MKLISMTDFVLEQYKIKQSPYNFWKKLGKYAEFLKQPLTLGMFFPCDEDGNVLEDPKPFGMIDRYSEKCKEYHEAKEKVLFEGFTVIHNVEKNYFLHHISGHMIVFYGPNESGNIEGLLSPLYEIELTESAIKQIGL